MPGIRNIKVYAEDEVANKNVGPAAAPRTPAKPKGMRYPIGSMWSSPPNRRSVS